MLQKFSPSQSFKIQIKPQNPLSPNQENLQWGPVQANHFSMNISREDSLCQITLETFNMGWTRKICLEWLVKTPVQVFRNPAKVSNLWKWHKMRYFLAKTTTKRSFRLKFPRRIRPRVPIRCIEALHMITYLAPIPVTVFRLTNLRLQCRNLTWDLPLSKCMNQIRVWCNLSTVDLFGKTQTTRTIIHKW